MNKAKSLAIIDSLKRVIKNPICELDFKNNFELICAVMLSAQTTDKRVNLVTKELFRKYPDSKALMNAEYEDVYDIISSVGLAKNKTINLINLAKCIENEYNGKVPSEFDKLILLPGVGRKTASVVLAVGFKIPAFPVDTHLHRLAYRFGYIKKNESVLKAEEAFKKYIPKELWIDAHHYFLLYGRYYCKAIKPLCDDCQLKQFCKIKK